MTAGGLMPPRRVLIGTYVAFGVAVACGIYLTAEAGWEILVIGIASIVAGVLYTGGPRPYGYEGLGEVFVFLFFGVVAVTGSYFVQTEEVRWEAFVLSVPVGLLASAILVVNNVRDVDTDRRAGKRTLAVKLGRRAASTPVRGDGAVAMLCPSAWPSPRAGRGCCCRWPRRRWCLPCCARWARAVTDPPSTAPWPTPDGCWPSSHCCWRRGWCCREALGAAAVPPLREPFVTAGGVVGPGAGPAAHRGRRRPAGYGEAAPLESYDGVSLDAVIDELRTEGAAPCPRPARRRSSRARPPGAPRGPTLGEPGADAIVVNRTLGGGPPGEMAGRAREAVREGYSCLKLKVGLPDDLERVAAVREAIGPWPALRVDANGAWSLDEARAAIAALAPYDLQLVEQPCRTLEELALLRAEVDVPLAADESIAGPDDVRVAAELRACDAVNVKLASAGGFGAAREAVRAARYSGLEPYLSSTLDGPWGIAAALQLAASERLSLACGLATLELFDSRLARALPRPRMGLMAVPDGPRPGRGRRRTR